MFAVLIPLLNTGFLSAALYFESYFFHFVILGLIVSDVLLSVWVSDHTGVKKLVKIAALPLFGYLITAGALFFSNTLVLSISLIATLCCINIWYFFNQCRSKETEAPAATGMAYSLYIFYSIHFFFSLSVLFFALLYFLDVPFWHIIIVFLLFSFIPLWYLFNSLYIDRAAQMLIGSVTAVLLTEILYAISWLPLTYVASAGVSSVLFIYFVDTLVCSIRNEFPRKRMIFTLVMCVCMIALLSFFVRWR